MYFSANYFVGSWIWRSWKNINRCPEASRHRNRNSHHTKEEGHLVTYPGSRWLLWSKTLSFYQSTSVTQGLACWTVVKMIKTKAAGWFFSIRPNCYLVKTSHLRYPWCNLCVHGRKTQSQHISLFNSQAQHEREKWHPSRTFIRLCSSVRVHTHTTLNNFCFPTCSNFHQHSTRQHLQTQRVIGHGQTSKKRHNPVVKYTDTQFQIN